MGATLLRMISGPGNRLAARRTAGAEMGRHRHGKGRCTHPTGNFQAKREGGGGPAENEKRLPHPAAVGRCDRRTESTEEKNGHQRIRVPITHGRPHVPEQRPPYASTGVEAGGIAENTIPRFEAPVCQAHDKNF